MLQVYARFIGEFFIHFDSSNAACFADNILHNSRVVSRACADFQHIVAGAQLKLSQHERHHTWLAGRTQYTAVGLPFDGNRLILIHLFQRHIRQEKMARHGEERLFQCRVD